MTGAHRHTFDTRRHEIGAVRKCKTCGAVQAKESGRWRPLAQCSTASRQLAAVVFASSVSTIELGR